MEFTIHKYYLVVGEVAVLSAGAAVEARSIGAASAPLVVASVPVESVLSEEVLFELQATVAKEITNAKEPSLNKFFIVFYLKSYLNI